MPGVAAARHHRRRRPDRPGAPDPLSRPHPRGISRRVRARHPPGAASAQERQDVREHLVGREQGGRRGLVRAAARTPHPASAQRPAATPRSGDGPRCPPSTGSGRCIRRGSRPGSRRSRPWPPAAPRPRGDRPRGTRCGWRGPVGRSTSGAQALTGAERLHPVRAHRVDDPGEEDRVHGTALCRGGAAEADQARAPVRDGRARCSARSVPRASSPAARPGRSLRRRGRRADRRRRSPGCMRTLSCGAPDLPCPRRSIRITVCSAASGPR